MDLIRKYCNESIGEKVNFELCTHPYIRTRSIRLSRKNRLLKVAPACLVCTLTLDRLESRAVNLGWAPTAMNRTPPGASFVACRFPSPKMPPGTVRCSSGRWRWGASAREVGSRIGSDIHLQFWCRWLSWISLYRSVCSRRKEHREQSNDWNNRHDCLSSDKIMIVRDLLIYHTKVGDYRGVSISAW